MKIFNATDLRRRGAQLLDDAKKEPQFITRYGTLLVLRRAKKLEELEEPAEKPKQPVQANA